MSTFFRQAALCAPRQAVRNASTVSHQAPKQSALSKAVPIEVFPLIALVSIPLCYGIVAMVNTLQKGDLRVLPGWMQASKEVVKKEVWE